MEAPIVIEILDRFGKVRERHKLAHFPIRIGRAYNNDIILDDHYVSPEHIELILDGDGHVLVTDLQSENGLFSLHPLKQHEVLTAEENQRIRIGHTDIRIRSENYPVTETHIDHGKPSILHVLLTNWLMLPFVLLLTAAITLGYYFLGTTEEVTTNLLLNEIFPVFIFILIWALGWSIASKLATHKFYFSYHAMLISLIVCAFYVIEPAFDYIEFNFPINELSLNLSTINDIVLVALLFYLHLRQSSNLNRKRTRKVAVMSSLIIVGFINLTAYLNEPEFSNKPSYSQFLKPPRFYLRDAGSIDDFFATTDNLTKFDIQRSDKNKVTN
jgi:hypothetical protein